MEGRVVFACWDDGCDVRLAIEGPKHHRQAGPIRLSACIVVLGEDYTRHVGLIKVCLK